jgi:hypothetical protein
MHRLSDNQRSQLHAYWRERGAGEPGLLRRANRGGWLRPWVPRAQRWLYGCESEAIARAPYVFYRARYRELMEALPRDQVACLAGKPAHVRSARQRGFPVHTLFEARAALQANFPRMRDPEGLDRAFDGLVCALEGPPGRFLVLHTDSHPVPRLLAFAARAAGMRSVCIQHGIIQRCSPPHIVDGWTADYVLCYDAHQQRLFVDKGMPRERLRILGFPTRPVPTRAAPPPTGNDRGVCVMGQPWGNLHPEREARYLELLREILPELARAGLPPVFKPHPRERGQAYLKELAPHAPIFEGSLEAALARFEVCISFTSTALLEATLAGRVALQVQDPVFDADDLSEAGYAHTLGSDRLGELADLCRNAAPLENPEHVLRTPEELAARFTDLLEKLAAEPRPAEEARVSEA